ncbi:twin-arginine translocase subunit TatC [Lederbergia citrea]|uniref:twin-arginine translocase subunit TatC n=1 Tax=Lederbergia citrea TaxID=2833581 RepID=UPI001BCA4CE7|nr:twin-arginine translocase subunit TatC [Lederbergia citrea]MBS4179602.1 twin-arginine translocase subunit TatC [Lederbergia citrea]MBS4206269.1 twin-arginine translocase subunit TatC [Lederbergia citrea]
MNQKDMTIFDHIDELRKRLMIIVVFFVFAVIVSFFLVEPLIKLIQNADAAQELTMNAFRVTDPFKVYMNMIFVLSLIMTSPVILYQLWSFVSPGLLEKERKATLGYIPISVLLFLAGLAFSYFVLFPFVITFMLGLSSDMGIKSTIGINEYFQFLFQITLPFGLLFQLPVVMLFLTRLGIITPKLMSDIRKYAYFVLLVIAAFITPPDIVSHLMVTVPLLILYEISIWISRIGYKKAQAAETEQVKMNN